MAEYNKCCEMCSEVDGLMYVNASLFTFPDQRWRHLHKASYGRIQENVTCFSDNSVL